MQGDAPDVIIEETPIEHEISDVTEKRNLCRLTIGIIGGHRDKQAKEITECRIIAHEGYTQDKDFESLLNESDELVILTRFISHASMWAAKAHAISEEKPIHYTKSVNLYRILEELKTNPSTV